MDPPTTTTGRGLFNMGEPLQGPVDNENGGGDSIEPPSSSPPLLNPSIRREDPMVLALLGHCRSCVYPLRYLLVALCFRPAFAIERPVSRNGRTSCSQAGPPSPLG